MPAQPPHCLVPGAGAEMTQDWRRIREVGMVLYPYHSWLSLLVRICTPQRASEADGGASIERPSSVTREDDPKMQDASHR